MHVNPCHYTPPFAPLLWEHSLSILSKKTHIVDVQHAAHVTMRGMKVNHIVTLDVSMPIFVCCRSMLSYRVCNRGLRNRLAGVLASLGVHEQGNDESVKTYGGC